MIRVRHILIAVFVLSVALADGFAKDIVVTPSSGSIQAAIDLADPGDVIKIAGGTYYESLVIKKSGISIMANGEKQVKITSAYPEYFKQKIQWKKEYQKTHQSSGREYTVYSAPYPAYRKQPKGLTYGYIADEDDGLYFTYRDKISFDYQYAQSDDIKGAYFDSDKVYLATEGNPNNERLYVSDRRILEIYNVGDITIDGGKSKNITLMHGGRYGIIINKLQGTKSIIQNLKIINSHSGILVNGVASGELVIRQNILNQYLEEMPWEFQKTGLTQRMDMRRQDISKVMKSKKTSAAYMETSAIFASKNEAGKIRILHNEVYGYFNGIVSTTHDVEIAYNTLSELRDDAIEIEGNTAQNIIHHNQVSCSFVGISLVPIRKGPVYIYQNELIMNNPPQIIRREMKSKKLSYRNGKTLKFTNLGPRDVSSDVHIYNNRFFALDDVLNIGSTDKPQYNPRASTFYNNVFISKGIISSSYGSAKDGLDYQGNHFKSLMADKRSMQIPEHKSWKNTLSEGLNFKTGIQINTYKKIIPAHWPGAKEINQMSE